MLSSDGRELNPNSEGTNANSHQKSVLVWKGTELEEKFLKAVHDLGKEATSNQILEHMEKNGVTGLTVRQVSSHLQKHRLKYSAASSSNDTLHSSSASGHSSFGSKSICGAPGNDDREVNQNSEGINANSHAKSVLDWTIEKRDEKFLNAVDFHGGCKKATRGQIHKHMMENGVTGVTVVQVSSYLQKHRKRCANDTSLTCYESDQKHLQKLQLKGNKTAGKRSAASSVSKSAQDNCQPIGNAQKKQMTTQSDHSFTEEGFKKACPTSQLDDELFPERELAELMDLNFHDFLASLDENTANSSNDEPNQGSDDYDMDTLMDENAGLENQDWDDDDIDSIFNDLDPIIPL